MRDRLFIFAIVVMSFAQSEGEVDHSVVRKVSFLQHPFHLGNERTIPFTKFPRVDQLMVSGKLTPIERDRQIRCCGGIFEPPELHQNGTEPGVCVAILRLELDRFSDGLLRGGCLAFLR